MKVKCLYNTGESLKDYEYKHLRENEFGRFGASNHTVYGEITIGEEYIVMGIITFDTYIGYLIDDHGFISICPCQLFEIVDSKINANWKFRLIDKDEGGYPFIQALLTYPELCDDLESYDNLIIEQDEKAKEIYFLNKLKEI